MASEPQPMKSKEYIRPITIGWWFSHPARAKFMVREISSFFLAGYCIFLIVLMSRAEDSSTFEAFYTRLLSPVSIVLHLIVLFFALFHSVTFFNLTPRAFIVRRGEERVPDAAVAGAHFAAWAVVSVIVIFLVLVV